jgi:alkylation response protein AidB-like acyl-CoA dehydrogenase
MTYDGHRVPASAVLGGPAGLGQGQRWILGALEQGRVNIAARACGVARAAFESAIRYAQQRHTFGKPIAEHQAVQLALADMATDITAARLLLADGAADPAPAAALMARVFAADVAAAATLHALRIHGGYGYITEFPVERYYRDAAQLLVTPTEVERERRALGRLVAAAAPGR